METKQEEIVQVNFRLGKEKAKRLKHMAVDLDVSMNKLIDSILTKWMDSRERNV